jgi:hypothetical protein
MSLCGSCSSVSVRRNVQMSEILVVLALVALLGVLHVIQWAVARPAAPASAPVGEMLRDLGGRDPWARALFATALVAITFAVVAPFVSQIGDQVGRILPG